MICFQYHKSNGCSFLHLPAILFQCPRSAKWFCWLVWLFFLLSTFLLEWLNSKQTCRPLSGKNIHVLINNKIRHRHCQFFRQHHHLNSCRKYSCFQKIWMISPSDYKAMRLLSFAQWQQFHHPLCTRDKFWRNFPVVPPPWIN